MAPMLIGFVFAPKDDAIIGCFLKHLITNGPPFPPCRSSCYLHNLDIFGPHPPWEIAAMLPEEQRNDFYVFTKSKKLTAGRNRRTAENGQGTWKGQKVGMRIDWSGRDNSVVVGEKKSYSFLHGMNKLTSHWNMYEYNVLEIDGIPILDDPDGSRWVICRVIFNKNFGKKSSGPIQESTVMPTTKKRKIPQQLLGTGSNIAGTTQDGAEESWNMFDTNRNVVLSADTGGTTQDGAEESWNMFDTNRNVVLSADTGGIQEEQPTAAVLEELEPQPFVDESDTELVQYLESMVDVELEVPSRLGAQEDQDQLWMHIENATAGFNEQETDNDSDFQHLLCDPAAAVEEEKECIEQQFKDAYIM